MVSSFNLSKLNSLLMDFYNITKIRITVFDENFHELIAYPLEVSPFCQLLRCDKNAEDACRICDAEACRKVMGRHNAYTYTCHAGLWESIVPLYMGNIVIGYLLFGHVFCYESHETGWDVIKEKCRNYRVDMEKLKDACWERPIISTDYIQSAAHIMQAVASYLCLEKMAIIKQEDLPIRIDEYIAKHYMEEINVQTICTKFRIGKTALYDIAAQNYGEGIAAHIRSLRIEKAKELLTEDCDMNISEISDFCGFSDYNYFITVFRHYTGMPPKQYRKLYKKEYSN